MTATAAQGHLLELITRVVHHADPGVPVMVYESTSWLDADSAAIYVAVEAATVTEDGWIEGVALLTAPERLDAIGPEVPSYYGQIKSMQPGTTAWGANRPATLYGSGFVLTDFRKRPNLGHVSRTRVNVAGWMPSAVTEWPEGPQIDSVRNALVDLGNQQPLPNLEIDRAMSNGEELTAAVKPGADDLDYLVIVQAKLSPSNNFKPAEATSEELESYLLPQIGRLAVPGVGVLADLRPADAGYLNLAFSRPAIGEVN